jgi:hypothetical protein
MGRSVLFMQTVRGRSPAVFRALFEWELAAHWRRCDDPTAASSCFRRCDPSGARCGCTHHQAFPITRDRAATIRPQLCMQPRVKKILYSVYSLHPERRGGRLNVGNVLMDRDRRRLRRRLRRWAPRPVVREGAMIDKHARPFSPSLRGGQAPEKSRIFR